MKKANKMDLDAQKSALIQAILRIEDESLLTEIASFLEKENLLQEENAVYTLDDKERFKPMTVEELERRIAISEEDIKAGRVYTTEEVLQALKVRREA